MVRASCGCPSAQLCLRCVPPLVPPADPSPALHDSPVCASTDPSLPDPLSGASVALLTLDASRPSSQGSPSSVRLLLALLPRRSPHPPPSGGDVGPHVSPARALCSLDLITPLMHLEASVAPTACWACYVPAPLADRIPDSRAHTCPPQTEHLTLFRGDLPSRSSEAAQQEWPELSVTCPTAPRPACASQVYRRYVAKPVSCTDCESLVLR